MLLNILKNYVKPKPKAKKKERVNMGIIKSNLLILMISVEVRARRLTPPNAKTFFLSSKTLPSLMEL
jgi:hypothetical protein